MLSSLILISVAGPGIVNSPSTFCHPSIIAPLGVKTTARAPIVVDTVILGDVYEVSVGGAPACLTH